MKIENFEVTQAESGEVVITFAAAHYPAALYCLGVRPLAARKAHSFSCMLEVDCDPVRLEFYCATPQSWSFIEDALHNKRPIYVAAVSGNRDVLAVQELAR